MAPFVVMGCSLMIIGLVLDPGACQERSQVVDALIDQRAWALSPNLLERSSQSIIRRRSRAGRFRSGRTAVLLIDHADIQGCPEALRQESMGEPHPL